MFNRDDHILLADIMVAIEKIQRYTAGYDKDRFLADERTIDAVVRNLEIVGEASAAGFRCFQTGSCDDSLAPDGRYAKPNCPRLLWFGPGYYLACGGQRPASSEIAVVISLNQLWFGWFSTAASTIWPSP
jgi:hypothetical protein